MKTIEMEIAMMGELNIRQNIIVPNVRDGMWIHECDLLRVTPAGWATEIEIKVSKADIKKDKEKKHQHQSNLIKYFYFAVPLKLKDFALEHIPDEAGLYTVYSKEVEYRDWYTDKTHTYTHYYVDKVKECIKRKYAKKWTDADMKKLTRLGTMRILGLKIKINKLSRR